MKKMKKIGLVLAGGGGRGAYQIGVWKALRETGLEKNIKAVSGTSVGGLNAALFIQNDLEKAWGIWESISMGKILPPKIIVEHNRLALFGREGMEKIIDDNLDMRCFDNSDLNCWVTVKREDGHSHEEEEIQDINDGEKKVAKRYIHGDLEYYNLKCVKNDDERKKLLLATSALPYVFPRVKIDEKVYADAGGNRGSIRPLYEIEKCDIILIVYLLPVGTQKGAAPQKYLNAKLYEIFPQENLGNMPIEDGLLDFSPKGAKRRMEQGYYDSIQLFQNIKDMIDSEMDMKKRLEDAKRREIEFREWWTSVEKPQIYSEMDMKKMEDAKIKFRELMSVEKSQISII